MIIMFIADLTQREDYTQSRKRLITAEPYAAPFDLSRVAPWLFAVY